MLNRRVTLEVAGIELAGQLYLPTGRPPYPTVCVCHGIPAKTRELGDGGYPLLAEKICRCGFAVLIFNFRGTGESSGNFDILSWTQDLEVAVDYLWSLPELNQSRLALLGFSAGAAVAIYVAAQDRRISSVVACASPAEFSFFTEADNSQSLIDHFRDLGIIRDKGFPPSIPEWLRGFREVSPIQHVAKIAPRPILFLHGSKDDVVAVSHAHRLYAKAKEPKRLAIIEEVGHRLRLSDEAVAIAIDWLKSHWEIDPEIGNSL